MFNILLYFIKSHVMRLAFNVTHGSNFHLPYNLDINVTEVLPIRKVNFVFLQLRTLK